MDPKTRKRIRKYAGYTAFFLAAFLMMVYATFPYGALAERITQEAKRAGAEVRIGKIGPGFFSVIASAVAVQLPREGGTPGAPILIDRVSLRPSLFPPGVNYSVKLFGGTAEGSYGALGKQPSLKARLKGIDLAKGNLKEALDLDAVGVLGGAIDLKLSPADASKMTGRIALTGDSMTLNGGTVAQLPLPRVALGRLDAELLMEGGKAQVKSFNVHGDDVEATAEGSVNLAQKLMLSNLDLQVKFKPADAFLKKNSIIQFGLNSQMSKDAKGFYNAKVSRMLGNPRFVPIR